MAELRVGQNIASLPPWMRYLDRNVDEYLTEFQQSALVHTVNRMRNDPDINSVLSAHLYALLKAKWSIESVSDKARDKEIAERVSANLLLQGPKKWYGATSWRQRLTEILENLSIGFSAFGLMYKLVDGKNVLGRAVYLHPSTIYGFELDDD